MKIYDRYEDYVAAFSDMSGPQPVYAAEALSDLYIDDASADGSEFCGRRRMVLRRRLSRLTGVCARC